MASKSGSGGLSGPHREDAVRVEVADQAAEARRGVERAVVFVDKVAGGMVEEDGVELATGGGGVEAIALREGEGFSGW
jgi:hypothetical protein